MTAGSTHARLSRISSKTESEVLEGAGEKKHTIYCINIEVGTNKYYLRKRYTDFLMLHQKLCERQYPEVEDFDFPPKVWFNTFAESLIEYRRERFETYLSLLLNMSNKYPPLRKELEQFLGMPQRIDKPKSYAGSTESKKRGDAGDGGLARTKHGPLDCGGKVKGDLSSKTVSHDALGVSGAGTVPATKGARCRSHWRKFKGSEIVIVSLALYVVLMWVLSFLGIVDNAKAKGSAVGMLCVAGVALCSCCALWQSEGSLMDSVV